MYFRGRRKQSQEISLSETIEGDQDGNSLSLMDVVSVDDTMLDDISAGDMQALLHHYIEKVLDEREQKIVILRYGLSGNAQLTQRETAEICGISRSYVSRIEKKALEKLRGCFEENSV